MPTLLSPRDVLFDGEAAPVALPVCDHYAGSEKLMHKSLALQAELGPVFDITFDCEDGALVGDAHAHVELAARLITSDDNRFGRVGLRVHDLSHCAFADDLDTVVRIAGHRLAYVMFPKWRGLADARACLEALDTCVKRYGVQRPIPAHGLIETHGALAEVFAIAALPEVESLSFGLMDFVSAHRGAIGDDAMRSPGQFEHPLVRRAKLEIAAACHAYGKVPSHNVTTDFGDPHRTRLDAERAAREFGYTRMWSIHPSQVRAIVQALTPALADVEYAGKILLQAQAAHWGPIATTDASGARLHDRASYRYYWSVLQQGARAGLTLPAEFHALLKV
ncbi:MAG TPA: aldolase/citrate lyase family protein [Burkholderiaceae bacterium]|nr:aldolase/citrate lyase family protein [Burkholderiaceae bacterium]